MARVLTVPKKGAYLVPDPKPVGRKLLSVPSEVKIIDEKTRVIEHLISAQITDRDHEVLRSLGCQSDLYLKANPVVFFNHRHGDPPVARSLDVRPRDTVVIAATQFAGLDQLHPEAEKIFRLYRDHFLNSWSVGFGTLKATRDRLAVDQTGRTVWDWELLEYSAVGIPSNPGAITQLLKSFTLPSGAGEQDLLKALELVPFQKFWDSAPLEVKSAVEVKVEDDPLRWNRKLPHDFDADLATAPPATAVYAWVSSFLATDVSKVYETWTTVPGIRMGAWCSALRESLAEGFKVAAIRNLYNSGSEAPPRYETIQLNSTKSAEFLVEGIEFVVREDGVKFALSVERTWWGLRMIAFSAGAQADALNQFLKAVQTRAKAFKFLKGEAFTVGGEFLDRGDQTWGDLYLDEAQLAPLKRAAAALAEKGADAEPRGVLLMGPPGTGKTMAGRVLMHELPDVTFIWLAARDFYRMDGFGGIKAAFDLAEENAPAIAFIEDADSWFDDSVIDLLKTEMDGIKRRKGSTTILTTNFPEKLPQALLDRPGRFHDVLKIDLPSPAVRSAMLARWLPDVADEDRAALVQDLDGYSGAHIKELARFAGVLRAEEPALTPGEAARKALATVRAQRELIASVQPFRPRKEILESVAALKILHTSREVRSIAQEDAMNVTTVVKADGAVETPDAPLAAPEVPAVIPAADPPKDLPLGDPAVAEPAANVLDEANAVLLDAVSLLAALLDKARQAGDGDAVAGILCMIDAITDFYEDEDEDTGEMETDGAELPVDGEKAGRRISATTRGALEQAASHMKTAHVMAKKAHALVAGLIKPAAEPSPQEPNEGGARGLGDVDVEALTAQVTQSVARARQ